jgi:1,4-alpha-glucan branching enzyme
MIRMVKDNKLLSGLYASKLNIDEGNKTIVFEKEGLIFVFNFHTTNSIPDYTFYIPEPGKYKLILNSDDPAFGGHGRIDPKVEYLSVFDKEKDINTLKIYNINRSCLVFKRLLG